MKKMKTINEKITSELIKAARKVRENAYAPYSNFAVGAAVLCEGDKIFEGCNVENVALGISICAERSAIVKAFSEGCKNIKAIAIVADSNEPAAPCGICRQVFYEFNPKMSVILANLDGKVIIRNVENLLPHAFERVRTKKES